MDARFNMKKRIFLPGYFKILSLKKLLSMGLRMNIDN